MQHVLHRLLARHALLGLPAVVVISRVGEDLVHVEAPAVSFGLG